jgi:hypothetical protein
MMGRDRPRGPVGSDEDKRSRRTEPGRSTQRPEQPPFEVVGDNYAQKLRKGRTNGGRVGPGGCNDLEGNVSRR